MFSTFSSFFSFIPDARSFVFFANINSRPHTWPLFVCVFQCTWLSLYLTFFPFKSARVQTNWKKQVSAACCSWWWFNYLSFTWLLNDSSSSSSSCFSNLSHQSQPSNNPRLHLERLSVWSTCRSRARSLFAIATCTCTCVPVQVCMYPLATGKREDTQVSKVFEVATPAQIKSVALANITHTLYTHQHTQSSVELLVCVVGDAARLSIASNEENLCVQHQFEWIE